MHFNQKKIIRKKLQGKTITTYYSREPEGTAALEHSYSAMLPAREIINHSNAQTVNSIGRVQTLGFPPPSQGLQIPDQEVTGSDVRSHRL